MFKNKFKKNIFTLICENGCSICKSGGSAEEVLDTVMWTMLYLVVVKAEKKNTAQTAFILYLSSYLSLSCCQPLFQPLTPHKAMPGARLPVLIVHDKSFFPFHPLSPSPLQTLSPPPTTLNASVLDCKSCNILLAYFHLSLLWSVMCPFPVSCSPSCSPRPGPSVLILKPHVVKEGLA